MGSDEEFYWPLLNMYWESSGFGLGGFYIGEGFTNRGKGFYGLVCTVDIA